MMNYLDIHFRPVHTDAEIHQTVALASTIWHECYTSLANVQQMNRLLEQLQSFTIISQEIRNEGFLYFLVECNQHTTGYISVQAKEEELFLNKLYLLKTVRGMGIAQQAMKFITELAGEWHLPVIRLTVNKQNARAIRFYEKQAFAVVGEEITDMGNGIVMNDFVMELHIS